jgi:hypothetical protein
VWSASAPTELRWPCSALRWLGGEVVQEERKVALFTLGALPVRFVLKRLELIGEHQTGLIEEPPDQCRLPWSTEPQTMKCSKLLLLLHYNFVGSPAAGPASS